MSQSDVKFNPIGGAEWFEPVAKFDPRFETKPGLRPIASDDYGPKGSRASSEESGDAIGTASGKVEGAFAGERIGDIMRRRAYRPTLGQKGSEITEEKAGKGTDPKDGAADAANAWVASLTQINNAIKDQSNDVKKSIEFTPDGSEAWFLPIHKAGRAGRDGDGDGVLNESDKRTAVASGSVAGAGAGAAVGAAAGRKIGERAAAHGSGARGKQWVAAAHNMTPVGMSPRPAVRTALNLFSSSEAARSAKFGAMGRARGGLAGLLAGGALAGFGIHQALNKSDVDEAGDLTQVITKAYADDVAEILASAVEDKAGEIAKSGKALAEIFASVTPKVDLAKADQPLGFDDTLALQAIAKASAKADEIVAGMVQTLTKSVAEDPNTLSTAIAKFDADMTEFLSLAKVGEEDAATPVPVAKAAEPVFQPLA